ncbi:phage tail protein I [Sulfurimonas sp.]|uniref:phage tail protein I n=1 Tax=Sulfurimonas sp. TaxID=2022749 RepID=UPI0025EB9AD0|nr:phage tail protein I [Sulfurimonas sp.]
MKTQSLIPSFEDIKLHSADYVASETFKQLSSEIKAIETLANPLECDEKYLPFLAYAFKVDFWDESLSIDNKRALITKSLELHKIKGTTGAVKKVFEALNMKATIKKWFEYEGEPYHFKIDLSVEDRPITPDMIEELEKYVGLFKNVRSILDETDVIATSKGTLKICIGAISEVTEIAPYGVN